MEEQKIKTNKIALNFGVILGIISILLAVILYITDNLLKQSWVTSVVGFLITIGVIVYALSTFKKANGGFMSLTEALKIGVGVALIGGLIAGMYNVIFLTYIEPDFTEQIVEQQRMTLTEEYPNFTEDQINQSLDMTRKFSKPWISLAFYVILNLFFGFIISLIAGLVMKKEDPYKA
ncbi:MAG: DUF4199 domain-containing protein [Leeuwenhoekiella sp.]